jgi:glycosyltransferase involved in cell wall biosynthesis
MDHANRSSLSVLQLTDSLATGGAERVAVNLANLLPRDQFQSHLVTTRYEGALSNSVRADVRRLSLRRRYTLDRKAISLLADYVRQHRVHIVHAHGWALFMAVAATFPCRSPRIVWHVHYGQHAVKSPWPVRAWYRLVGKYVHSVIAVSQPLVEWSRDQLGLPSCRVCYVPNFVCEEDNDVTGAEPPGSPGARIACVANLRPEKDHPTLIRAMATVAKKVPHSHLLLVGGCEQRGARFDLVRREIQRNGLSQNVSLLGTRRDVGALLRGCDIGVLSSVSEGLPLALLEYGRAGLAVVATRVGQCQEVLDDGRAGLLVPAGEPDQMASALLSLLHCPARRRELGNNLSLRVRDVYSPEPNIAKVCQVYESALQDVD